MCVYVRACVHGDARLCVCVRVYDVCACEVYGCGWVREVTEKCVYACVCMHVCVCTPVCIYECVHVRRGGGCEGGDMR